jgi:hypothetical protein
LKQSINNLRSIEKKVFVLKLDDFVIDNRIFYENEEFFVGIFDLYKHKEDFCDGYEFRSLIKKIENENISIRCVSLFIYEIIFILIMYNTHKFLIC